MEFVNDREHALAILVSIRYLPRLIVPADGDGGGGLLGDAPGQVDLHGIQRSARAEDGDPVDVFGQMSSKNHSVPIRKLCGHSVMKLVAFCR